MTRAIGGAMVEWDCATADLGRIALVAVPRKAPYTTSKHAVTGIMKFAGALTVVHLVTTI